MSDLGRPKFENLIMMIVLTGQRRKVGVSRILIKNTLVEKYGVVDDKRTSTRIRDTIKKLLDDDILEPITAHSFHLSDKGLKKAGDIKASDAWKNYNDRLAGKTVTRRSKSSRGTKKTTSKGKARKSTKATPKAKGITGKNKMTPKTPSTPKGKSRGSKSSPVSKKRAPMVRPKKVHFDAVVARTPSASIRAKRERDERAKRMEARHKETHEKWIMAHTDESSKKKVSNRKAATTSKASKDVGGRSSVGKKRGSK